VGNGRRTKKGIADDFAAEGIPATDTELTEAGNY